MIGVAFISGILAGLAVAAFLRPKPKPPEASPHVPSAIGVGNTSAEAIDAEWTKQIFAQLASGRFFEIRI
jgi:hypothetical protein